MEEKRIFIGGLAKDITEKELEEKFTRFGHVSKVEIKTRSSDNDSKTFAYLNLTAEENAHKRCFSAYNNTKWKGGQLKLQYAKESFLSKLKREREEAKSAELQGSKSDGVNQIPALEGHRKSVPGTPMDENGTWVMGKYGRVLPVLRVRKPGTGKLVTLDPSKTTHCLKKLKSDDFDAEKSSNLTWHIEEDERDITKWRQGKSTTTNGAKKEAAKEKAPKQGSIFSRLQGLAAEEYVSDTEMEIVPVGRPKTNNQNYKDDHQEDYDSAGSADTDEIVSRASYKKPAEEKNESSTDTSKMKMKRMNGSKEKMSSGVEEPLYQGPNKKKAPRSSITKKVAHVDSPGDDSHDVSEEQKPQFKFIKPEKVKDKCLRKSVKQTVMKTSPVSKEMVLDNEQKDEVEEKVFQSKSKAKKPARTPMFRGMGMLLSDTEDSLPSDRVPKRNLSQESKKEMKNTIITSSTPMHSVGQSIHITPAGAQSISPVQKEKHSKLNSDSDTKHSDDQLLDFETPVRQEKGLKQTISKKKKEATTNSSALEQPHGLSSGTENHKASVKQVQKSLSKNHEKNKKAHMEKSHQAFQSVKEQMRQKENLITKSLREGTVSSQRVLFSDEEEATDKSLKPKPISLFEESDSEIEVPDFSIRPQFEGSKGQKLLELQSRVRDERFHFDERFQSDSEEEEEEEEESKNDNDSDEDMIAEKRRNMEILEKVLGYKPEKKKRITYEDMNQKRYDPTKAPEKPVVQAKTREVKQRKRNSKDSDTDTSDSSEPEGQMKEEQVKRQKRTSEDSETDTSAFSEPEGQMKEEEVKWRRRNSEDSDTDTSASSEPVREMKTEEVKRRRSNSEDSDTDTSASTEPVEDMKKENEELSETTTAGEDTTPTTFSSVVRVQKLGNLFTGGAKFCMFGELKSEDEIEESVSEPQEIPEKKLDFPEDEDSEPSDRVVGVQKASLPVQEPIQEQPSFMIAKDDPRLTAAVKFFQRSHENTFRDVCERWSEERHIIMQLVRDRHKKACRKEKKSQADQLRRPKHKQQKQRKK